jgi:tRNA-specific 2-thiouridylase
VFNKKTQSEPLYVIKKDVTKNIIFVSPKPVDEAGLLSVGRSEVELKNLNLTTSVVPKKLKCRLRYRQEKVGCHLEGNKVIFDRPQFGVSAGQSLVFYVDDICLGGGVIE